MPTGLHCRGSAPQRRTALWSSVGAIGLRLMVFQVGEHGPGGGVDRRLSGGDRIGVAVGLAANVGRGDIAHGQAEDCADDERDRFGLRLAHPSASRRPGCRR